MSIPIWIDCDTGVDDAVALLVANYLDELEIVGISAVAGNVGVDKTCPNAIRVCDLMGRRYPVYEGAAKPWVREQVIATYVHGESGLGEARLPAPSYEPEAEPAWDGLFAAAKERAGELVLVAVGPLTNVATALAVHPQLTSLLKQIVIMGGSVVGGNSTPAAEFNIYADPEAAQSVFLSGVPVVMCGLDVTMQAAFPLAQIDELNGCGHPAAQFYYDATRSSVPFLKGLGFEASFLHDVCTVVYLAHPELFEGEVAGVFVETRSPLTYGQTVCDLLTDTKFEDRHVTVLTKLDHERFLALVKEALLSY